MKVTSLVPPNLCHDCMTQNVHGHSVLDAKYFNKANCY
jgi:hypothetical protein